MDEYTVCFDAALRVRGCGNSMLFGLLDGVGGTVVCASRVSKNNSDQLIHFYKLCPQDVSVSDGWLFNGENNIFKKIYRDAMRLRNVRGIEKLEALVVPLMISASETAEELSAAAVTRGIENPAPKTSVIRLHMGFLDWISIGLSIVFMAAAFII